MYHRQQVHLTQDVAEMGDSPETDGVGGESETAAREAVGGREGETENLHSAADVEGSCG